MQLIQDSVLTISEQNKHLLEIRFVIRKIIVLQIRRACLFLTDLLISAGETEGERGEETEEGEQPPELQEKDGT